jgi:hypothetical protein
MRKRRKTKRIKRSDDYDDVAAFSDETGVHGASDGGHMVDHGSDMPLYHRCVACSVMAANAIVFM